MRSWWKDWQDYARPRGDGDSSLEESARQTPAPPGEIDNSVLLHNKYASTDDSKQLKTSMQPGRDYEALGEASWSYLQRKYGGGPELKRPVLVETLPGGEKNVRVMVHPYRLQVSSRCSRWWQAHRLPSCELAVGRCCAAMPPAARSPPSNRPTV